MWQSDMSEINQILSSSVMNERSLTKEVYRVIVICNTKLYCVSHYHYARVLRIQYQQSLYFCRFLDKGFLRVSLLKTYFPEQHELITEMDNISHI